MTQEIPHQRCKFRLLKFGKSCHSVVKAQNYQSRGQGFDLPFSGFSGETLNRVHASVTYVLVKR